MDILAIIAVAFLAGFFVGRRARSTPPYSTEPTEAGRKLLEEEKERRESQQ